MDSIYMFLVAFGGLGFTAMVLLGFLSTGGHGGSHHGGHAHTGHHVGHSSHSTVHHAASGHHAPHADHGQLDFKAIKSKAWIAISPIDIFSLALGAGATGVFLKGKVSEQYMLGAVILGAFLFLYLLIKPLMSIMLRFASTPSDGLEAMIAKTGEAASKFDADGRGLVKLTLDGQVVQLLGQLDATEIAAGVVVAPGDRLLIVEVDAAKNRCRVIKETS